MPTEQKYEDAIIYRFEITQAELKRYIKGLTLNDQGFLMEQEIINELYFRFKRLLDKGG